MAGEEKFDFSVFLSTLKGASLEQQRKRVQEELGRMRELVVREPGRKFQQQIYVQRLERLRRFLDGQEVTNELTPSELQAYVQFLGGGAQAGAGAAPSPEGQDRREARRISMKTRVRIRRDSGSAVEVLEPLNVSRGGIGFQSAQQYALHEVVWVTLHYQPGTEELETRSMIVRAVPLPESGFFSYGVKFLGE